MYKQESDSWVKHIDFTLIDVLCIQVALLIAYLFRNGWTNPFLYSDFYRMAVILTTIDFIMVFFLESYKGILERGYFDEFKMTLTHVSATIIGFILFNFVTKTGEQYSRIVIILMWELAIIFCYIARTKRKEYVKKRALADRQAASSMIAIVDSSLAEHFVKRIHEHNFEDRKLSGIIIIDKDMVGQKIAGVPVVASKETAVNYMCQHWVDEVITHYNNNEENLNPILEDCKEMGIAVHIVIMEHGIGSGKSRIENISGYTVVTNYLASASNRQLFLKRAMDICGGIVGCILTVILFVFIAPVIYIKSPGPIFFSQIRVGKNGKRFKIYKFRSMYMDAEERKKELMEKNKVKDGMMFKMDNDPRIIKGIGHFIRKTSIDEFPQFFNVLKGDMSLVGTRPPTIDEWEKYKKHHRRRMAIKPGLTGMWQVSGRSDITDFEEVVALDTKYIMEWNMGLDIKILLKTVGVMFTGRGSQ
ncbi:MAG: sugar transferase [Lachnospiraceae bacterium]|nr:sugar transferase [Lachnospiraceae bacterium]